ncbi:MAG: helix-turn-helix domain-containing protein [Muribaculaceae bacterium]
MQPFEIYSQEEALDLTLGQQGTPQRDAFDAEVEDYLIGLAIRNARQSQNLTQEQLGQRIGVQRSRICSIEKGVNLRLSTLRRVFTALGLNLKLDISGMQPISLC